MKKITTYFFLSLSFLGLGQTATTVNNGIWTSTTTWSTSTVPSTNNTTITVGNIVIANTSIGLSGTASLLVTGSLIDPMGSSTYGLSLSNFSSLTVDGVVSFEGSLSLSNSATVTINNGATLTVGSASFSNNTVLIINTGGSLIINGNLNLANNNGIIDNGSLTVGGNLTASNNVTLSGTGSASVSGTSSTSNGATIFGGQGSCTNCSFTSSSPLPIELLYFNANLNTNGVDLNWETMSETNNNYFTIEKSKDGIDFDVVQEIKTAAANGNSTGNLQYKMLDTKPYDGVNYYRLKQTDFNGKFKYYEIVQVNYSKKSFTTIYPNPATNNFLINASEDYAGAAVKITDAMGREVITETINATKPTLVNTNLLVPGIYYVIVGNEGGNLSKTKIVIQY